MSLHLVLFRLKSDPSYQARYASLIEALDRLTATKWQEASSAYVLTYPAPADRLAAHLLADTKLYRNGDDLLEVFEIEVKAHAGIGVANRGLLDLVIQSGQGTGLRPLGNTLTSGRSAVAAALMRRG